MAGHNLELSELPFRNLTNYSVANLFQTSTSRLNEILRENGITNILQRSTNPADMTPLTEAPCEYINDDSFKILTSQNKFNFSIFHQNIRSLSKHVGQFWSYLQSLNFQFDVIMLSEIGQKNFHIACHVFNDYQCFFQPPTDNPRGGVAIFIKSSISKYTTRKDLEIKMNCTCSKCQVESLFIEIPLDEKYILGCVYRHPNGNIDHFTDAIFETHGKIRKNLPILICGDINIDLTKTWQPKIKSYIDSLAELGFLPTITIPTRITDDTQTLIDHIYIRSSKKLNDKTIRTGVLFSDISDHLPIFLLISNSHQTSTERKYVRLYGEKNIANFKSDIQKTDWTSAIESDDVNDSYSKFINIFTTQFEKHFPLVKQSRARQKDKKWMTLGLRKSITTKNKLLQRKINRPTEYNINKYKDYNSRLQKCLENTENNYYMGQLKNKHESNCNFWKIFGSVVNPKRLKKSEQINKVLHNEELITDRKGISSTFNNFFSNVGEELNQKFPRNTDFKKFLKYNSIHSIYLTPIIPNEIKLELEKLKINKSSGPDDLPVRMIKIVAVDILTPLSHIYNLSMQKGQYPDLLKISKVIALFKKGNKLLPHNYRPISLLDIFDKVYERLLHCRLVDFLNKTKAFFEFQFGFRDGHSTILALTDIIDNIKKNIDNNEYTIGIFLDLTKAFDTVDHEILLEKLKNYGIRGNAHSLLKSYLSNRFIYTVINGVKSEVKPINYGVPQGSVLGPLLFTLYINDIMFCIPKKHPRLFADDTGIFNSGKCLIKTINEAQRLINKLTEWFDLNKLTINVPKCAWMIFKGKRKKIPPNIPSIFLHNQEIPRVNQFKYIGLQLDPTLSWKPHIHDVCSKLNRFFGIFRYLRSKIPQNLKRQIYLSTASPLINYGIELYGSGTSKMLAKLQSKQNQLLKVLYNKDWLYGTNQLHNECKLIKVNHLYELRILSFVRKCLNKETIPLFQNYFSYQYDSHRYDTRNDLNLSLERSRTTIGASTIKSTGPKLWNSNLTAKNNLVFTIETFKHKLKDSYINTYEN